MDRWIDDSQDELDLSENMAYGFTSQKKMCFDGKTMIDL